MALADQLRHVPEEEGQQQRRDVMAVGVGVHQQDDLAVAQAADVELVAGAGADGRDQVVQLWLASTLFERQPLGVEDLAAQGQDGLRPVVAALLGRAAGAVALDDEQLRFVEVGRLAVGELAGQVEPALRGRLALDLAGRLARRQAGLGGQHDAADDLVGGRLVGVEPGFQRRPHEVVDRRRHLRVVELLLGLPLEHAARARTPTGCRRCPRGCPRP